MRLLSVCLAVLALVGCGSDGGGDGDGSGSGGASGFFAGASGEGGTSGVGGSSGGGGGGRVSTGLSSTKVLGDVTATEAETLCASLAQSSENAIDPTAIARLPCTIAAFSSPDVVIPDGMGGGTIDRAACEASVNECLQAPAEPVATTECDADALMASLADCDATASELEACLNASLPQIRNLLDLISCTTDLSQMPPSFQEPPACASLDMKCPGVLDVVGNVALPDLNLGVDDEETFDAGAP